MPAIKEDVVEQNSLEIQTERKESCSTLDLNSLRLSQNFGESVSVTKLLNTVPVQKPRKTEFFRINSNPDNALTCGIIEFKEDNQIYLVNQRLQDALALEIVGKILCHGITKQGVNFLWPIKLPDEAGNLDSWNKSALEAADIAKNEWIRLSANRHLGAYEIMVARGDLPEPIWPQQSFTELLTVAFRGRVIDSLDHPAVRRLRGED